MTGARHVLAAAKRVVITERLTDPRTAWGRCVIESAALVDRFNGDSRLDVSVYMVTAQGLNYGGRTHSAVVMITDADPADWQVIDPTARQFDANVPAPWTGTLVDWYDAVVDWLGDHLAIAVYDGDIHAALGVAEDPWWTDTYTDRDDVSIPSSVTYGFDVAS